MTSLFRILAVGRAGAAPLAGTCVRAVALVSGLAIGIAASACREASTASPYSRSLRAPFARVTPPAIRAPNLQDGFAGALFRDYASAEFDVEEALLSVGFPLPRAESRRVTQEDFPTIIEATRRTTVGALGPGADQP